MLDLKKPDFWLPYVPFLHPGSPAPFVETAFQQYDVRTPAGVRPIKSMLSSYELAMLFALAKDYWTGQGEIVDLGCLYGLTTRCFAEGAKLNGRVADAQKIKRIYAYDLFLAQDYEWWTQASPTIHAGSWFPEFLDLNKADLDLIVPCPGDLLAMNWGAKPIEILMVDAAKTWALNQFVVTRMFPALIPGQSVVVQQDYFNFAEYWIAITMEYFADYFEPLDAIYGASATFRTLREIPPEAASFDLASLPASEKVRLMDQAIGKARDSSAEVLKTAKATLLIDLGELDAARETLATVRTNMEGDRSPHDFSGIAAGCAPQVAARLELAARQAG